MTPTTEPSSYPRDYLLQRGCPSFRELYNGLVLIDVAAIAVFLTVGNVMFRHFEPRKTLGRRLLKTFAILIMTALISYYFGRIGVVIAFGIAAIPVICVHAIWLPRHGVNGWTAEPREKYYALRGWPPPEP